MNKIQEEAIAIIDSVCKYRTLFQKIQYQLFISSITMCILFIINDWINVLYAIPIVLFCMGIEILASFIIFIIIDEKYTEFIDKTSSLTEQEYEELRNEALVDNKWNQILDI